MLPAPADAAFGAGAGAAFGAAFGAAGATGAAPAPFLLLLHHIHFHLQ